MLTHVVLLANVHLAPVLTQTQLLLFRHLSDLPVVFFVANSGGGCKDEGAGDNYRHEGKTEEKEGVLLHHGAVLGGEGVGVRLRRELLALERHFVEAALCDSVDRPSRYSV